MFGRVPHGGCAGGTGGSVDLMCPSPFRMFLPGFDVDRRLCWGARYALLHSFNVL